MLPLVNEMLQMVVARVPPDISPEAVIISITLNDLIYTRRGLYILMPLLSLNEMKLIHHDVLII